MSAHKVTLTLLFLYHYPIFNRRLSGSSIYEGEIYCFNDQKSHLASFQNMMIAWRLSRTIFRAILCLVSCFAISLRTSGMKTVLPWWFIALKPSTETPSLNLPAFLLNATTPHALEPMACESSPSGRNLRFPLHLPYFPDDTVQQVLYTQVCPATVPWQAFPPCISSTWQRSDGRVYYTLLDE